LLALGGDGERDDPRDARVQELGDPLDRPALAGGVAPLEDHDDSRPRILDPLGHLHELLLQTKELLVVGLARQPAGRAHAGTTAVPIAARVASTRRSHGSAFSRTNVSSASRRRPSAAAPSPAASSDSASCRSASAAQKGILIARKIAPDSSSRLRVSSCRPSANAILPRIRATWPRRNALDCPGGADSAIRSSSSARSTRPSSNAHSKAT